MQFSDETTTFHKLPYEVQLAHLTDLAKRAIAHHGLDDATVDLTSYTHKAVYRVATDHGMFALHIHRAGTTSLSSLHAERMWMKTLAEHRVHVPVPIGDIYTGTLAGETSPVYCTLTTWLTGQSIAIGDMTDHHIRAIGRLIGRLHTIATSFVPPADFARPTYDDEGLFGENSPYNPKHGVNIFTDEQKAVMRDAQAYVVDVFSHLGKSSDTFGLIHADLIPNNLIWDAQQVGAIDFEYCGYGYYLYDLAPFLWMARHEPNANHIRVTLWEGYTQIRPQPTPYLDYLPAMIMARHIASCRWIAGNLSHPSVRDRAPQIIAERVAEMKSFLTQSQSNH